MNSPQPSSQTNITPTGDTTVAHLEASSLDASTCANEHDVNVGLRFLGFAPLLLFTALPAILNSKRCQVKRKSTQKVGNENEFYNVEKGVKYLFLTEIYRDLGLRVCNLGKDKLVPKVIRHVILLDPASVPTYLIDSLPEGQWQAACRKDERIYYQLKDATKDLRADDVD